MGVNFADLPYINDPAFITGGRSAKSIAYEALWRSMRPSGSLPHREAFLSADASLVHLNVLVVERLSGTRGIVRAAGSEIVALVGPNIVGSNYIEMMPEAKRKEAWWTLGAMVSRPCGLWELIPVYIGPKIASVLEITALPVIDEETGHVFVASYLLPCATTKETSRKNGVSTDAAVTYEFLDLGAGIPDL